MKTVNLNSRKIGSTRPLTILILAIVLSNCTSGSPAISTTSSTTDPISSHSGTPSVGPLYYNIDSLSTKWNLSWDQARRAYIGRQSGIAQISLTEFDEGYVIGSYIFDGSDEAAPEYVAEFQEDALRAVLPNGPIQNAIWEFVVDSWDHFWETSGNNSEYYSGPIRGRNGYYEIALNGEGGLEEFIGVGKFQD